MQIEIIRDPLEDQVGDFTPAIRVGNLVTISSQGSCDPAGNYIPGTIEEETERTLANIHRLLKAAGADMQHIIKVNCYLRDLSADFDRFNTTYKATLRSLNAAFPCRTTVGAQLFKGYKIVMDVVAVVEAK